MPKRQPDPDPDEDQGDYMERCVIELIDEGTDPDDAVTECQIAWDESAFAIAARKWPTHPTWRGEVIAPRWRGRIV